MNNVLLALGAATAAVWGIAHLFPTKSVVENFGEISDDNRHIITMEWINEGLTLIFIGVVVIITAFVGDDNCALAAAINSAASAMLIVMAGLSVFTGFKVNFLPFKLCPVIFTVSALLILLGTYL